MGESRGKYMKNRKLLSIGELSRLTGVNIKSLRYYDSIGVLPPSYVNPENGYRYYSFNQMYIVEAIQFCVALDIPLKHFFKFVSPGEDKIHYLKLLNYGKEIAAEKINSINKRLEMLEGIQNQIERTNLILWEGETLMHRDALLLWITPYSGPIDGDKIVSVLREQILQANSLNLHMNGDSGLLHIYEGSSRQEYVYTGIEPSIDTNMSHSSIICAPAGDYMCRVCQGGDIFKAASFFPWIDNSPDRLYVFESEMVLESYDFNKPVYELRCSM